MRLQKLFLLGVVGSAVFGSLPVAAAVAPAFLNPLSRSDLVRYGVNPWRTDTDNDGYPDAWEVKNGYCPTNPEKGVRLGEGGCRPGTIDWRAGGYNPPPVVAAVSPRPLKKFTSCAELIRTIQTPLPDSRVGSSQAAGHSLASPGVEIITGKEPVTQVAHGSYLYVARSAELLMIKTEPLSALSITARVTLPRLSVVERLVRNGNTLAVVGADSASQAGSPRSRIQLWQLRASRTPALAREFTFDGTLREVVSHGGYLYVVLEDNISVRADVSPSSVRLPAVQTGGAPAQRLACSAITRPVPSHNQRLLVVWGVPLNNPRAPVTAAGFLGFGSMLYSAEGRLYLGSETAREVGWDAKEQAEIFAFTLARGAAALAASQWLPGSLLDEGSLSDYQGVMRLTTALHPATSSVRNNLYLLTPALERFGWYEGAAAGKELVAARFFGSHVFLIPRDPVEPWEVFDLSKPRTPLPLGTVASPGGTVLFKPFSTTTLLSLYSAPPASTSAAGFKPISLTLGWWEAPPAAPAVERFATVSAGAGATSSAFDDHAAFTAHSRARVVTFPVVVSSASASSVSARGPYAFEGLYVYSINPVSGFSFLGSITHQSALAPISPNRVILRGLFVGSRLLALSADRLTVHEPHSLELLKELSLAPPAPPAASTDPGSAKATAPDAAFAADRTRLTHLRQLQRALTLYYTDQGQYPEGEELTLGTGAAVCLDSQGWHAVRGCLYPYLEKVPQDPGGGLYRYRRLGTDSYVVEAVLEGTVEGFSGPVKLTPAGIRKR